MNTRPAPVLGCECGLTRRSTLTRYVRRCKAKQRQCVPSSFPGLTAPASAVRVNSNARHQRKHHLHSPASQHPRLAKLEGCDAQSDLEGFTRRLRIVPARLRKALTYDQGTEMALHEALAKRTQMDVYFCDPDGHWQRASNENANGLIRECLPQGTDLSTVAAAELRAIEARLNGRPRQILRFQTPGEVFSSPKLNAFVGVALEA